MKKIKIISDGTAFGTKVYTADGVDITEGLVSISIERIKPGTLCRATLEYLSAELEITTLADTTAKWRKPRWMPGWMFQWLTV